MNLSLTKEQADVELQLFALIRDLRVEAKNIVQLLDEIEQKSKLADAKDRSKILQETILSHSIVYKPNKRQISKLIDTCRDRLVNL